ncbi:MAG: hypothetical protein LC796_13645 [Acidobacteria bacterium]|nr:hypothetical protein [Acidobacteriota bacterium]MCA1610417.1 hypothetical protein [Acidobacteriota bacterium]
MSVEGGIKGTQHKIVCPNCKKTFTAWRPDTEPAVKVKCYFCKTEVEDEPARRVRAAAPPQETAAPVPSDPAPAPLEVAAAPPPIEN